MHNWQENEIKELLIIRASEAVRNQITGTVKDSAVYNRMTKLLAEKGVFRSHMQVISKLKALRKQYSKYHQQKTRCGGDRVDWPFYELCHQAFANAPVGNPVRRHRSPTSSPPPPPPPPPQPPNAATTLPLASSPSPPTPLPPPAPPPPPTASSEEHPEVVVSLWDEVDVRDINKHLGPVEAEDEEEPYSPAEQLHTMNTNNVAFKPESGLWSSEVTVCRSTIKTYVCVLLVMESVWVSSVHGSNKEKENHRDGASFYSGVGDHRPAQRNGRRHAGAGGCPAAEVNGPREGNAEQSNESAHRYARTDQSRKPRETPGTGGQTIVQVPFTVGTFRPLMDSS
ncbi:uncharacterized protein LOC111564014 isoform X1 [Amphiprion ocellaris]|uniref:uncharacterized protein LOC111564014 isoform X1 n=1 Tax=Amphiprion ocellaris TaxID=80972 RepID=UPI00241145E7|nr:uncharacterized protein LOC111564014 isoform X1 [Amphiprion ocellaris]XP_035800879.2 uncharacterized protein LOC111564014 isoform X1 [Amphiprion ocellaris]XP_054869033.1 uncharacterized protein LOC111564014 isoform X1 [Amphiprion ocellaris]